MVISECGEHAHDERGVSDIQQRNWMQPGSRATSTTVSRATMFSSTGTGDAVTKADTNGSTMSWTVMINKMQAFGTH